MIHKTQLIKFVLLSLLLSGCYQREDGTMALVRSQEWPDASSDAQALEDVINGAPDRPNPGQANGTVTTRTGRVLKTLANLQADPSRIGPQGLQGNVGPQGPGGASGADWET